MRTSERRRTAAKRVRDNLPRGQLAPHPDQASLTAYVVALLVLILMLVYSFEATKQIEAFGLTFQTAAVRLATPELLRGLHRIGYFRRSAEKIRRNRKRLLRMTLVALLCAALSALVLVAFEVFHWRHGLTLSIVALSAFLLLVLFALCALALGAARGLETIFEEVSDDDTQQLMSRLLTQLGAESRWAIAGVLFLLGTVLQYGSALSG